MKNKQIGLFLKELRILKKLTQKDLAHILNITPQTVSKWEVNTSLPNLEMLALLSKTYKLSVSDIIQCKKEKNNNILIKFTKLIFRLCTKHKIVFILYALMLLISIIIPHLSFITSSVGSNFYPILTEWKISSLIIFLPILLSFTFIIDKKKTSNVIISMFAIILLLKFFITILVNPLFISFQLGIVFLILYILILLVSSILVIIPIEDSVFNYKLLTKQQLITVILLFVVALPLPFLYSFNDNFNFDRKEQFLYLSALLLPALILLKNIDILPSRQINTISLIFNSILIYTTIAYLFKGGMLVPAILLYVYIITLANEIKNTFRKDTVTFKILFPMNILIVDIFSVLIYIDIFTNGGDMFFGSSNSYSLIDFGFDAYIYLNIILLLIAISFRVAKLKILSHIMYTIWGLWLTYFTTVICINYIFNTHYYTITVIHFIIPPLLFLFYLATNISYYLINNDIGSTNSN